MRRRERGGSGAVASGATQAPMEQPLNGTAQRLLAR